MAKKRSGWMRGLLDAEDLYKRGYTLQDVLACVVRAGPTEEAQWVFGAYAAANHYARLERKGYDVHPK